MYLLITRNNPYLEELNRNPQNQALQKNLEGMEIDLKNQLKVQEMDMKDYDLDNQSEDHSFSEDEESSKESSLSLNASKLKPSQMPDTDLLQGKDSFAKRNSLFKNYIRLLEIFSSIIIIVSEILCLLENEHYYKNNIYIRATGSLLINGIFASPGNNSWQSIFNKSRINLTSITEFEYLSMPIVVYKYMKNHSGLFTNVSNFDVFDSYNITPQMFNYKENETSYDEITIPLTISPYNKSLRMVILGLTLGGIVLVFCLRYIEHLRDDNLIKELEIPFYKSKYCLYLLMEIIFLLFFQYPTLNNFILFKQLGIILVLPLSSIFSAVSTFRLLYVLRIIKAICPWDSLNAERICAKYSCEPGFLFSFKALQKTFPFLSLLFLFLLICISFALCIRIFELHYWETQSNVTQNWKYTWNALWCVFVSMTTVGYGDFYPKTHFGRMLIICSCISGVYFISLMMMFMAQKSLLTESEQKAYKLITRIQLRNKLKDINSQLIFHALQMSILSKRFKMKRIEVKEYKMKFNYERREIIAIIDKGKIVAENLKSFDIIPTKEQLYDISERIETDIKEIKGEIEILQKMNISFIGYTDTQVVMMKYLKKCILSTKLVFDLVEKKPEAFGVLGSLDKIAMLEELEKVYNENEYLNKGIKAELLFDKQYMNANAGRRRTNPNQYDELVGGQNDNNDNMIAQLGQIKGSNIGNSNLNNSNNNNNTNIGKTCDEYYADELAKYQVSPDEFKEHFEPLFFDTGESAKKAMKSHGMKTIKAIKAMKEMKKKIDAEILQRRGGGEQSIIDENSISEKSID